MNNSAHPLPPLASLKQLAIACEAVELRVRAGQDAELDSLLREFPAEFRQAARDELQAVIDELTGSGSSSEVVDSAGVTGGSGERFQILQSLGEGGMGRVVVAWDRELSRRVALKEIRLSALDDVQYRQRFQQESTITANLEHPGIIPIYARGTFADDRPFYAMRLIAGGNSATMQQAIHNLHQRQGDLAEFRQQQRELLRRLVDVCNTVAYAHSQGICHRDLKPENVLFGPFGETVVVDWGLARQFQVNAAELTKESAAAHDPEPAVDKSSPPIGLDSPGGTRGYAAPEVVRNESILNWPALDIYSLGAVLYCILTGHSPWEARSATELSRPAAMPNNLMPTPTQSLALLPRPRQLKPAVPRSVEAICWKAMSDEPSERYESALKLAADLECFLADEPVSVITESHWERFHRRLARNRAITTSAALLILVTSSAITAFALLQTRYNRDLTQANQQLLGARDQEVKQREAAENAQRLAANKSEIATRNEQRAMAAIRAFAETVSRDQVLKLTPELQNLRRELLRQPIQVFQQMDSEHNPAAEMSLDDHQQLALVAAELARLSWISSEIPQAMSWSDRAIERYDRLLDQVQQTPLSDSFTARQKRQKIAEAKIGLGDSYQQKSHLASDTLQPVEAVRYLERARELFDQVEDDPAWQLRKLKGRALVLSKLAIAKAQLNELPMVVPVFEQAIQDRQAIVDLLKAAPPTATDDHQQLAQALTDLQDLKQDQAHVCLLLGLGNRAPYLQQFDEYIQDLRRRMTAGNDGEAISLKLAWALTNHGTHLLSDQQISPAIDRLTSAVVLRNDLRSRFPSVVLYQVDASRTLFQLATALRKAGQLELALQRHLQAIDILRQIHRAAEGESNHRVDLAIGLHDLGHLYLELFQDAAAVTAFEESFTLSRDGNIWNSNHPEIIRLVLETIDHEADRLMQRGEWSTATTLFQQMWQLIERSPQTAAMMVTPERREHLWRRWQLCCLRSGDNHALAELQRRAEELERADSSQEQQRQQLDELLSHEPLWPGYRDLSASHLQKLAQRSLQHVNAQRAVELLRVALDRPEIAAAAAAQTTPPESNGLRQPARWELLLSAAAASLQIPGGDAERLAARQQSLQWMQESLPLIERQLAEIVAAENSTKNSPGDAANPQVLSAARQQLVTRVWEQTFRDPVFASVRSPNLLSSLSAEEREAWSEVWKSLQARTMAVPEPKEVRP